MINTATRMLATVHRPPEGTITYGLVDEYLTPCGFTIYRTDYNIPDQVWESLLNKLTPDFKEEILYTFQRCQHVPEEREATEKLLALVQFDGRSDPATLNGASMDQLRVMFQDRTGGAPLNANDTTMQYFLLADTEVLEAASQGKYWVKIVEVRYDNDEYKTNWPRLTQVQSYWGWMRIATTSLLFTRIWLRSHLLSDIEDRLWGNDPQIMDERVIAKGS